jgi:hypothetical protein
MKNTLGSKLLAVAFLVAASISLAHAQATRTWVSGVGNDANPCSRTAPCKTFAGAISKTAEGGEIDVLDPGGFGSVTITKAMTIDGTHGAGFGSVLNAGNIAGVTVNVTTGTFVSTAAVTLRGLYFQAASQSPTGTGSSSNGINYLKADRVIVSDCHFENQGNAGIRVSVSTSAALFVRDCEFTNVNTGISVNSTAGTMVVEADNINVQGSTSGVVLSAANGFGLVTNSNLSRNIGGSAAQAGSGCTLNLTHTHFHANSTAINALAGSTVRVNECELFDNASGFAGNASSIQSGGNNKLAGNASSVTPTGPPLTTQ